MILQFFPLRLRLLPASTRTPAFPISAKEIPDENITKNRVMDFIPRQSPQKVFPISEYLTTVNNNVDALKKNFQGISPKIPYITLEIIEEAQNIDVKKKQAKPGLDKRLNSKSLKYTTERNIYHIEQGSPICGPRLTTGPQATRHWAA